MLIVVCTLRYIIFFIPLTQLFLIWQGVWTAGRSTGSCVPAARMSATATVLQQFVSGLKSRNEDLRAKAAKDLQHYVITELREVNCTTLFFDPSIYIYIKLHRDFLPKCNVLLPHLCYDRRSSYLSCSVFKQTRKETCLQKNTRIMEA